MVYYADLPKADKVLRPGRIGSLPTFQRTIDTGKYFVLISPIGNTYGIASTQNILSPSPRKAASLGLPKECTLYRLSCRKRVPRSLRSG
jgi:hypothetical protein